MSGEREFWHLSQEQADGTACVVCGVDYRTHKARHVPVGRSAETRSQVFACAGPCALHVVREAEDQAREMIELAGLDDFIADGGDGASLGQDGEFGYLLRDLRILVGVEALLTASSSVAVVRFLLSLAGIHGELASQRARLLVLRLEQGDGGT
ncbi:hypothetical protein ACFPFX_12500 [Streptomyces mauvecolor]|uniref:Uncharacterized protein n=1 Tax=Streptomyces mauvecolor TaxID=58345 RepID=A0ABV9UN65_9ACTN